jgi:hypothetical protein
MSVASKTGKMMEALSAISRCFMRSSIKFSRILFIAEYCTLGKLLTQDTGDRGGMLCPPIADDAQWDQAE